MAKVRPFLLIGGLALIGVLPGCTQDGQPHGENIPGVQEHPTSPTRTEAPSAPGTTGGPPTRKPAAPTTARTGGPATLVTPPRADQRAPDPAPAREPGREPAREPGREPAREPAASVWATPSSEQESTSTTDAPTNTNSLPETTTPTGDIPGGPYTPE